MPKKSKCLIAAPRCKYMLSKSDVCTFSVGGKLTELLLQPFYGSLVVMVWDVLQKEDNDW